MCISFDRVLEISTQLGDSVVSTYLEKGVVCPAVLQKGIFTTSAVDNIDHNPSATTTTTSFYGTGISVFQHPTSGVVGGKRNIDFLVERPKSRKVSCLPESYTNVMPAYLKSKPSPPPITTPLVLNNYDHSLRSLPMKYEWLQFVSLTDEVVEVETVSWSYHASRVKGPQVEVSTTSLLPLLNDQAHSVATIKHTMDKVKEVTQFLNPAQCSGMAVDQPLFAIAKQIQWQWSNDYGEDKFVMFGGLHIEMAALKLLGDLLRDVSDLG